MDLKRLAASVAVAALAAKLPRKRARMIAAATVEAYRSRMQVLAKLSPLEIWHNRIDLMREIERVEDPSLRQKLSVIVSKAAGHLEEDDNFPHLVKGNQPRIDDRPPLIYHFTRKRDDAQHRVHERRVFASYQDSLAPERRCLIQRYALKDVAFKVVGVGSVGTFCAIGLFMSGDGAPLFLQIKEAGKSVLECLGPKFEGHPGERVVEGQRVMQAASDVFLGWTEDEASGRYFYVRHLKNRRLGTSVSWWKNRRLGATRVCAAARWHVRTHARRTRQYSRDTWAKPESLTMRLPLSPWPTRSAPNATTIGSRLRSALQKRDVDAALSAQIYIGRCAGSVFVCARMPR